MKRDAVCLECFIILLSTINGRIPTRRGTRYCLSCDWKHLKIPPIDDSPDVLRNLSIYFGVTVSDLLDEEKAPTPKGERNILKDVDIAFYGEYQELSADDKETVRDMVRVMRERRKSKG